jgi:general secretion pathway protein C
MLMTNAPSSWFKIVTFALSAAAAASVVYWGLKTWHITAPLDVSTALLKPALITTGIIARALGGGGMPLIASTTAAPPSTRYALIGIVANRSGGGVALISVDGKTAKPVRVGGFIDDRLMLQSVESRRALLAVGLDKPTEVTLELLKPVK